MLGILTKQPTHEEIVNSDIIIMARSRRERRKPPCGATRHNIDTIRHELRTKKKVRATRKAREQHTDFYNKGSMKSLEGTSLLRKHLLIQNSLDSGMPIPASVTEHIKQKEMEREKQKERLSSKGTRSQVDIVIKNILLESFKGKTSNTNIVERQRKLDMRMTGVKTPQPPPPPPPPPPESPPVPPEIKGKINDKLKLRMDRLMRM